MSGLRNIVGSENASNIQMAGSYLRGAHEIHVLLVDHEVETLFNTAQMLELCGYGVTCVATAAIAMSLLMRSKISVDLIMANINSPDNQSDKLLELSVSINIPIILMSFDDNIFTKTRAIESGALLCLQKPMSMEMLKYLWQLAMRERLRKPARDHQRDVLSEPTMNNNRNNVCQQEVEMVDGLEEALELEAIVGGNINVNNGLELGAIGCNNAGVRIEGCRIDNEFGLRDAVVSNNVNNGLEFGAIGGTYVNDEVASFGANNVNNQLEFCVAGRSNVNSGLELGALGGCGVNNRLEVGAIGRGKYANDGPEFGVVEGFIVNNGLQLGVAGGNTVNNGLEFRQVGGKYFADNEPEHGAIGGRYVNNRLGLRMFGGNNNNVNNGLELGASLGCMWVNKDANNKGSEILEVISDDDSEDEEEGCHVARKHWEENHKGKKVIEWTEELHTRFVYAVRKLGPGRCFPKEIKKLMNVPGLTRMQVASHLQKCRNNKWRSPEERKNQLQIQSDSASKSPQQSNNPTRARYGSMPKLTRTMDGSSYPSHSNEPTHTGLLQNVITTRSSSGPMNMATVANVAGAGDAYNHGLPMIPCQTTEMNAIACNASAGVGTQQQGPSNPNYLGPNGDLFDFPNIEMLLQNIPDPMPQANQNANCPENQWSGSDPNSVDR